MVDWQTYVWVPSASESVSHTNSENKNQLEWEVWAKDNKSKDDERQVNNRKCGAKKIYAGKTSSENEQKWEQRENRRTKEKQMKYLKTGVVIWFILRLELFVQFILKDDLSSNPSPLQSMR